MSAAHRPNYLVQYYPSGDSTRIAQTHPWDGKSLLKLGHPTEYVIQNKNKKLYVRNFRDRNESKEPVTHYPFDEQHLAQVLKLEHIRAASTNSAHIRILPLKKILAVDERTASSLPRVVLPPLKNPLVEDVHYQKVLKQVMGFASVFAILLLAIRPGALTPKVEEELVPQKYAKLLLTKPKNTQNNPASGGSAAGSQAKAVAKVLQSKTAQQSLRNMLKGGLTKYSLMSTGKSIQNLNQSINAQAISKSASLENKTKDLMLANNSGAVKMGSESGYTAGSGLNIKGQGQGSAEVGLDTADAVVDEGLSKEEVAKVIHSHISEIRFCYESAIVKDPTLAGKVVVDFKISAQGKVATSKVSEATLSNPSVGNCLMGKMKNWKFPNPRGGVTVAVSYPFVFKSLAR